MFDEAVGHRHVAKRADARRLQVETHKVGHPHVLDRTSIRLPSRLTHHGTSSRYVETTARRSLDHHNGDDELDGQVLDASESFDFGDDTIAWL